MNKIFNNIDELGFNNEDLNKLSEMIKEAQEKYDVKDEEELVEKLPVQNNIKHGEIELVKLNGLALTEQGILTRAGFFENLEITKKDHYGDIMLTKEEANKLSRAYRKLSTGVNSIVPMTCKAYDCKMANRCPYVEMDKAPLGRPCLLEEDMLNYHTVKFMNQFDVKTEDHSEVLLVQELAELVILEMRLTIIMSGSSDSLEQMMGGWKIVFSPEGDKEELMTEHWAFAAKEKIKNRRMKILDSLMATRKVQAQINKNKKEAKDDGSYTSYVKNMKAMFESIRETEEVQYTEINKEDLNAKNQEEVFKDL